MVGIYGRRVGRREKSKARHGLSSILLSVRCFSLCQSHSSLLSFSSTEYNASTITRCPSDRYIDARAVFSFLFRSSLRLLYSFLLPARVPARAAAARGHVSVCGFDLSRERCSYGMYMSNLRSGIVLQSHSEKSDEYYYICGYKGCMPIGCGFCAGMRVLSWMCIFWRFCCFRRDYVRSVRVNS